MTNKIRKSIKPLVLAEVLMDLIEHKLITVEPNSSDEKILQHNLNRLYNVFPESEKAIDKELENDVLYQYFPDLYEQCLHYKFDREDNNHSK